MNISIVAARSLNGIIGNGLKIPWVVKGEQALFKKITMGGILIMGRKTFDSLGRALPGRETIIISRNENYNCDQGKVCSSLQSALAEAEKLKKSVFIAGGGQIYELALPVVNTVHISTIEKEVSGDVPFPKFPTKEFILAEEHRFTSNVDYTYQRFERRK